MHERSHQSRLLAGSAQESRLVPLSIAGLVCFVAAVTLGYGGWYLFGTHERAEAERPPQVTQSTPPPAPAAAPPPQHAPAPAAGAGAPPAGELPVAGGAVSLGGDGPENPARREFVEPFRIAETEVTNEQYREFVKATSRKPPAGWPGGDFPAGAANEPVTGVDWQDAADYCRWLSEKTGVTVRLPTEAEWELAAKGRENYKYPWGNEWNERAADSAEGQGRVRAVKSFPAGVSPSGAYDMAGNVWEWVADQALDKKGNPKVVDGVAFRIIKGGAAKEPRGFITTDSRYGVAADQTSPALGFRYVVKRAGEQPAAEVK